MQNKSLSNEFWARKIINLFYLARLHSPIGYLLSFYPAGFGLILAYEEPLDLMYLPMFFIGSVIIRSAGCVLNDLMDKEFDKHITRTKNRPIANGQITIKEALAFLAVLSLLGLYILMTLSVVAIILGFIAFLLIILYPLMKRYTHLPQIFLGATFNIGTLIAYAAVKDNISYNAIILYIACIFWTIGYDTIYAFMDIKDDKEVGVKSTAILIERYNSKSIIFICYVLFLALFLFAIKDILFIYTIFGFILSVFIIFWIMISLDINAPNNCLMRFKLNNYIGFILFLSMLLEKL